VGDYDDSEGANKESKVAPLEKFSEKKGGEVYRWLAQLRLVFRSKPRAYQLDEDKIAYALSYMAGAAQNWAIPILQELNEGHHHDLLVNNDAFQEAMISVYGKIDWRSSVEDCFRRIW